MHSRRSIRTIALLFLFIFVAGYANAQTPTPTVDQGTNPYSSLHGGDFDSVVLSNGNLLLNIPLISYPQRGSLHLGFSVAYDNRTIYSTSVPDGPTQTQ